MIENKTKALAEKVKQWRKKKELTQDKLARNANVPYTTLAKIESGVIKNPSIETVMKIANGLGITLDQLIYS